MMTPHKRCLRGNNERTKCVCCTTSHLWNVASTLSPSSSEKFVVAWHKTVFIVMCPVQCQTSKLGQILVPAGAYLCSKWSLARVGQLCPGRIGSTSSVSSATLRNLQSRWHQFLWHLGDTDTRPCIWRRRADTLERSTFANSAPERVR